MKDERIGKFWRWRLVTFILSPCSLRYQLGLSDGRSILVAASLVTSLLCLDGSWFIDVVLVQISIMEQEFETIFRPS